MAKLELSQQKLNSVKKAEEYYNALRTNIQLSGNNLKVITVTSVDPSEGKSTTSTNIAWAFCACRVQNTIDRCRYPKLSHVWSIQIKRKNHWFDRLSGWHPRLVKRPL